MLSHPYEQMFSTEEIIQHIENVGFRIDDVKTFNPFLVASVQWKGSQHAAGESMGERLRVARDPIPGSQK